MLLSIHVKNLAIIEEVEVEFSEHLNTMTGETGAGKSIIIGSINMVLGDKISADMIRKGADYALVEAVFTVDKEEQLRQLEEWDIPVEDDMLIISRKIQAGRNVCKVNGEKVTTSALKKIAGLLIDIHGQHEHQSLLYKNRHLEIVDRFQRDETEPLKIQVKEAFQKYRDIKKELEENQIPEGERLRELSLMEYEYKEITEAALKSGEEEELEEQYKRLSHSAAIGEAMSSVHAMMEETDGSVSMMVGQAVRELMHVSSYDEEIEQYLNHLTDIEALISDFSREVSGYLADFSEDGEALTEVEKRLDLVRSLKARFGATTEEVLAYAAELEKKIERYQEYESYMEHLEKEKKEWERRLEELCSKLSTVRKKSAESLQQKITEALIDLNFLTVRFEAVFEKKEQYGEDGFDRVEFLLSTNLGEDLKPLAKAASGGELSRVMLAIKAVLAEHDEIPTLIFDEIDVGISGRTAQKVSEKLALISRNHQVICITHLAQIAAMGDAHYLIEKSTEENKTATSITILSEEESVKELARILGGAVITESAMANAGEMKEMAKALKVSGNLQS